MWENDVVSRKELEEFNKALIRMVQSLSKENDVLKEKLKFLEDLLKDSDVPIIGE